jgi:hypothetical protein
MKTQQAAPVLRYNRIHEVQEAIETEVQQRREASKLNEAVTWAVLSICLAAWAVVGFILWIPKVLRAVFAFSVDLVQSTLTETTAEAAGRRLRSAANFYRRGFVGAVESIRRPARADSEAEDDAEDAPRIEPGLLAREAVWAIVVWYALLWSTGVLRGTPVDLAAVPWSTLWSGWVDAIWSVPELFRN